MKIKLSKNQWESMGKQAGWIKEAVQTPSNVRYNLETSRNIDEDIRQVSDFRLRGSITMKQFFENMESIRKRVIAVEDKDDRKALVEFFNHAYYNKI